MNKIKTLHNIIIRKGISVLLLISLFVYFVGPNYVFAKDMEEKTCLAPRAFSQNLYLYKDMYAELLRNRVILAVSDEAKSVLAENDAKALLIEGGEYLVSEDIAFDDEKLIRGVVHEDIEAFLQVLLRWDASVYNKIKELVLPIKEVQKHYSKLVDSTWEEVIAGEKDIDLILNDILAHAFELILTVDETHIIPQSSLTRKEQRFLRTIRPVINSNRHNYFTERFFNPGRRQEYIKLYLTRNLRFKRAAMTVLPGVQSPKESKMSAEKVALPDSVDIASYESVIRYYYELKKVMMEALDKDREDDFRQAYQEMKLLLKPIQDGLKRASNKELVDAARKAVLENNVPDFLVGQSQGTAGVGLAARTIRDELDGISREKFSNKLQKEIDGIVDEIVDELYEDRVKKNKIREQLKGDIVTHHFTNLLPEEMINQPFSEWKEFALGSIAGITRQLSAAGSFNSLLGKVFTHEYDDGLLLRCTIKHEIVHYLSYSDEIKVPHHWEQITYAVDILEHIKHGAKTVEKAEKRLENNEYLGEFGPAAYALYMKGKEIGKQGEMGFLIKPGSSDNKAGYFAMDVLVAEARGVYEQEKLPTDELMDTYHAQKVCGIMIGGILIGMQEGSKEEIKPLKLLRDFFEALYARYAPPAEEDMEKIKGADGLVDQVKKYMEWLMSQNVEMKPSDGWMYERLSERRGRLRYLLPTFYPRVSDVRDKSDKQGMLKAALERGYGNVLLAVGREEYGKREIVDEVIKEGSYEGRDDIKLLWDTVMTPEVFEGIVVKNRLKTKKKIKIVEDAAETPGAPLWISRVLREPYDIGNELVERAILTSQPLNLQFIDSLLYRWVLFSKENGPGQDPRLVNEMVKEALNNCVGTQEKGGEGWGQFMYSSDSVKGERDRIFREKILPEYNKLYAAAMEREAMRRAYERMLREDIHNRIKQSFEQMMAQDRQGLRDYMEQLPEQTQQAIEDAVSQDMQQMVQDYMQEQGQQMGGEQSQQMAGQQGQPTSGQQRGKGAAGGLDAMQAEIENLEQSIRNISDAIEAMRGDVENVRNETSGVESDASSVSQSRQGEGRSEMSERISSDAENIQGQVNDILNQGRNFEEQTDQNVRDTDETVNGLPSPEEGRILEGRAEQLEVQANELLEQLEELQREANQMVSSANRLENALDKPVIDESHVTANADMIQNSAENISTRVGDIQGRQRRIEGIVDNIRQELGKLQDVVGDAKKPKKEEKGERGDKKPKEDVSVEEVSGEAQQGEGKPGQQDRQTGGEKEQASPRASDVVPTTESQVQQFFDSMENPEGMEQAAERETKAIEASDTGKPRRQKADRKVPKQWLKESPEIAKVKKKDLTSEEKSRYKGLKSPLEKQITNMKEILRGLIIPTVGMKIDSHRERGPLLRHLVDGAMGGKAFARRIRKQPLPVKISFLIDRSGSMAWEGDAILYTKTVMLVLLEVLLDMNEELETRGFNPIEFEVGFFEDEDKLYIDHESSGDLLNKFTKEKVIYDLMKELEGGGGTEASKALDKYVKRLINREEMTAYPSRRLFFFMTDEACDVFEKEKINGIIEMAEEGNVAVFPVLFGEGRSDLAGCEKDRIIELKNSEDFKDMPRQVMACFANYLAPPKHGDNWMKYFSMAFASAGLTSLAVKMGFVLGQMVLKEHDVEPEVAISRIPGYKYFHIEKRYDGKEFLVYEKGKVRKVWERGLGGDTVPYALQKLSKYFPETEQNAKIIRKIIDRMYRQGEKHVSYGRIKRDSGEESYMMRNAGGKEIELLRSVAEGEWKRAAKFSCEVKAAERVLGEKEATYQNDSGIKWRRSPEGMLELSQNNGTFLPLDRDMAGDASFLQVLEVSADKMYVFDPVIMNILIFEKNNGKWEKMLSLSMETKDPREKERRMIELEGEPGVGKGTILRAVSVLLNDPFYLVPGNEDMQEEDLRFVRTMGIEKAGVSSYSPSALAHVLHYGGIFILDERNKVPQEVINTIKADLGNGMHTWYTADESGRMIEVKVPNHPRAQIVTTANLLRKNIHSAGGPLDQPMQERKRGIKINWLPPNEEVDMQMAYVKASAKERGLYDEMSSEEIEEYDGVFLDLTRNLVSEAVLQRLKCAGYDYQQRELLTEQVLSDDGKESYPNWNKLENKMFFPKGENIGVPKRAMSPRVVKSILDHFVAFPKDMEYRKWSTIRHYFNFEAERDKDDTYQYIENDIKDKRGFVDDPDVPEMRLTEDSFIMDGEVLRVVPTGSAGEESAWDELELPLHPDAAIRNGSLPYEVEKWIKSSANQKALYTALQAISLGRHLILVGEAGAGKSTLAKVLALLLSGPEIEEVDVTESTDKEGITFQAHIGEEGKAFQSGYTPKQLPRAMNTGGYGKILIFEETPQGRPGMLALLNEVTENGYLLDPSRKMVKTARGFACVHAINKPGEGNDGSQFSEEFLERHFIIRVDPIPAEEALEYLEEEAFSLEGEYNVNPRLIGAPLVDDNGDPVVEDGRRKWGGLLGVEAEMRRMLREDPRSLPRAVSLRVIQDIVQDITDQYDDYSEDHPEWSEQEIIWDIFSNNFTVDTERVEKETEWWENIRKAFINAGLWEPAPEKGDAVKTYLQGAPVIVEKLEILKAPDTQVEEIDKLLVALQENTRKAAIDLYLEQLDKKVKELTGESDVKGIAPGDDSIISDVVLKNIWDHFSFSEKLKRVYALKEIDQILKLIYDKRVKDEGIQATRDVMWNFLVKDKNWPEDILENEEDRETFLARYPGVENEEDRNTFIAKDPGVEIWEDISLEELRGSEDLLGKAVSFMDDNDYMAKQLSELEELLRKKIMRKIKKNVQMHEVWTDANYAYQLKGMVETLEGLIDGRRKGIKKRIKGLVEEIERKFEEIKWPLVVKSTESLGLDEDVKFLSSVMADGSLWQKDSDSEEKTRLSKKLNAIDERINEVSSNQELKIFYANLLAVAVTNRYAANSSEAVSCIDHLFEGILDRIRRNEEKQDLKIKYRRVNAKIKEIEEKLAVYNAQGEPSSEINIKMRKSIAKKKGGYLEHVFWMAVDSETGNIFGINAMKGVICVLNRDGELNRDFGKNGDGIITAEEIGISSIQSITIDQKTGDIFIVDSNAARVSVLTRDGKLNKEYGQEKDGIINTERRYGYDCEWREQKLIATDGNGNIFIIGKYDRSWVISVLTRDGTPREKNSLRDVARLVDPLAMAIDQKTGNIFIIDGGASSKVVVVGRDFKINTEYGQEKDGIINGNDEGFLYPREIDIDQETGDIFISVGETEENKNDAVVVLTRDGKRNKDYGQGKDGVITAEDGIAPGIRDIAIDQKTGDIVAMGLDTISILAREGAARRVIDVREAKQLEEKLALLVIEAERIKRLIEIEKEKRGIKEELSAYDASSPEIEVKRLRTITAGMGAFNYPSGMAIDKDSNIFVANFSNNTVSVLTLDRELNKKYGKNKDGIITAEEGEFENPSGIAIDKDGNLFVTNSNNNTVSVLTPDGELNKKYGKNKDGIINTKEGKFNMPNGIAIDKDGNIFVANNGNNTVSVLTPDGELNEKYGKNRDGVITAEEGKFYNPHGIAIDKDGIIFVANSDNNTVSVLTPDGKLNDKYGKNRNGIITSEEGGFNRPNGIVIDKESGEIVVSNQHSPSVSVLMQKVDSIEKIDEQKEKDLQSKLALLVTEAERIERLIEIEKEKRAQNEERSSILKLRKVIKQEDIFKDLKDIASDENGNMYVANGTGNTIIVLTAEGELNSDFGKERDGIITGSKAEFNMVYGIKVENGNIFSVNMGTPSVCVLDRHGALDEEYYKGKNGILNDWTGDWDGSEMRVRGFQAPIGIAIREGTGDMFVTNSIGNTVSVLKRDGESNEAYGSKKDGIITAEEGEFDNPHGIAIDRSGNIFAANFGNNTVSVLTPAGKLNKAYGKNKDGIITAEEGNFDRPHGIAIGKDGSIFVANFMNNTVSVLTPAGKLNKAYGSKKDGIITAEEGKFDMPTGISINEITGDIFVANENNTISVLTHKKGSGGITGRIGPKKAIESAKKPKTGTKKPEKTNMKKVRNDIEEKTISKICGNSILRPSLKDILSNVSEASGGQDTYTDIRNTVLFLCGEMEDILEAEGRYFEIRYDGSRFSEEQKDMAEEYVRSLNERFPQSRFKLKEVVLDKKGKGLFYVRAFLMDRKTFIGDGSVDIETEEDLGQYQLRVIGVMNIAIASSMLSDNEDRLSNNAQKILKFIQEQYFQITEVLKPVEELAEIVKHIVLPLPKKIAIDQEQKEYYATMKKMLKSA